MGTYRWYPSDFALIDWTNPSANDHESSIGELNTGMWMHFAHATELDGKEITAVKFVMKVIYAEDYPSTTRTLILNQPSTTWDEERLTYNNARGWDFKGLNFGEGDIISIGDVSYTLRGSLVGDLQKSMEIINALDSRGLAIGMHGEGLSSGDSSTLRAEYYTPAAEAENRPYLEIEYEEPSEYLRGSSVEVYSAAISDLISDPDYWVTNKLVAGEKCRFRVVIGIPYSIYGPRDIRIISAKIIYDSSPAFNNPKYVVLTPTREYWKLNGSVYYEDVNFNPADIGEGVVFDSPRQSVTYYLALELVAQYNEGIEESIVFYSFNRVYFDDGNDFEIVCPEVISLNPANGAYIAPTKDKIADVKVGGTFAHNYAGYDGVYYWQDTEHLFTPKALRFYYGTSSPSNYIDLDNFVIPANTLSPQNYVAKYGIILGAGMSMESNQFSFTSIEPQSTTTNLNPSLAAVDGSKTIRLSWNHTITTGTAQTGFKIQYRYDTDDSWITLVDETDSANQFYDLTTDHSGSLYWRVATYNSDNVLGVYSEAVMTVISASPAPAINTVENKPMFFIGWSATEQLGYEISLDGETIKADFGATYNYRHNDFIPDGAHTVAVRVQNQYGLWSDWGTTSFIVQNGADHNIKLRVNENHGNAVLRWSNILYSDNEEDGYVASGVYYVYRNGKLIHVLNDAGADLTFTDYFPELNNTYTVKPMNAYGYYSCASVTLNILPECITLTDTGTGAKLFLPLSDTQTRESGYTMSHQFAEVNHAGNILPSVEIGTHQQRYYSFRCAFKNSDARKAALEALLARDVCLVDQYGERIFGVFTDCKRVQNQFRTAYDITLTEAFFDETKAGVYR